MVILEGSNFIFGGFFGYMRVVGVVVVVMVLCGGYCFFGGGIRGKICGFI